MNKKEPSDKDFAKMFEAASASVESNGEMDTAAIHMHEMFSAFRRSGFSRRESLYLVAKMLVGYGSDTEEK